MKTTTLPEQFRGEISVAQQEKLPLTSSCRACRRCMLTANTVNMRGMDTTSMDIFVQQYADTVKYPLRKVTIIKENAGH